MRDDVVPPLKCFSIGDESVDLDFLLNSPFEDIREACERIPAAMGYLGYHKAYLGEKLLLTEKSWKEAESRAYFALRGGRFQSDGYGDKMTEGALDKAVELDAEVIAQSKKYAFYKRQVDWLVESIKALSFKIELVRSSETTRRLAEEPEPRAPREPRERQK